MVFYLYSIHNGQKVIKLFWSSIKKRKNRTGIPSTVHMVMSFQVSLVTYAGYSQHFLVPFKRKIEIRSTLIMIPHKIL